MSVGDVLSEGRSKALKTLAFGASVLVYLGSLIYSAIHNINLMSMGVSDSMLPIAILGVVCLEITALSLPIALHWWFFNPLQRIAGFAFYAVDLVLLIGNIILSFGLQSGQISAEDAVMFLSYVTPITPIVCGLGWSLLWLLDPSQKQRAMFETLRASTQTALAARVAESARAADIDQAVKAAADQLSRDVVMTTLGVATTYSNGHNEAEEESLKVGERGTR